MVNKCTGSLGGNGSGGAIYGEQTQASMQKVVDLMVTHAGLDKESVFIDVGSGLGKPNMHVGLQPKVKYSVGIEMEYVRWLLSLHNLKHCLHDGALTTTTNNNNNGDGKEGGGSGGPETHSSSSSAPLSNTILVHANCFSAKSFDPFTHVYMFDIGMVRYERLLAS